MACHLVRDHDADTDTQQLDAERVPQRPQMYSRFSASGWLGLMHQKGGDTELGDHAAQVALARPYWHVTLACFTLSMNAGLPRAVMVSWLLVSITVPPQLGG